MVAKQSGNSNIYKEITAIIGKTFKKYRENSGLSMREIYKQEKISIAVMSDMESGKKLPRVETLIRLMGKVNMPLEEVFSEKLLKDESKNLRENSMFLIKLLLKDLGYPMAVIKEIQEFMKFKDSKNILPPENYYK